MQTAIVTGSSSGIGAEIATRLHGDDWNVVLNGFESTDAGSALAANLPGSIYHDADLSDFAQAAGLIDVAEAQFGSIDLVVNNAGIAVPVAHDDLDSVTDELWQRLMNVNLTGVWNVCKAAIPHLQRSSGQIVNNASLAGVEPMGSSIPYAVSKAGVVHLTKLLAKAFGPAVRVNAVAPGYIDTPLTHDWEDLRKYVVEQSPAGRLGQPSDVADAVIGLLKMSYVTGAIIPVAGGLELL
ncbi:SDR family NAD(P)-dependent oxidoreductase [Rhodococcoides fascians]|uniref:SDR family NAD(P)-dependent oxidoreductase n=1 Tax=Rhodococcoides fascians TaxID=1828 RepID=UPI00056A913D|nr:MULTISPECIES: SDR family oxidoreductase [Rhodococcus]OZF00758.1 NAD(P)-dependent oxidoreductase [Rhodococcus sp. 15-1189-1-1a]OZF21187.1 NAD(P)-dependent oxidoreductase [Rhodococcus sp. 14-2686-1-2]